jgi:NAD(P)-dependent dehydrogenase (short-subunit alcohol dehydrogenase family)
MNSQTTGAAALAGKVAIVTGASRGIGRAIAEHLLGAGASVLAIARDAERLQSMAQTLSNTDRFDYLAASLTDPWNTAKIRTHALTRFGGIDILVNSAGATKVGDFLSLTEVEWNDGFALKFSAARRLSALCWPDLVARRGSILNIVGAAGRTPGADYALGGSVNAALLALTKALAQRGLRDGVRVNAINPGPTLTDRLMGQIQERAQAAGTSTEDALSMLVASAGMTRLGKPEDIAALAVFVLSPAGSLFQGALIDMDGGQTKTI